MNMIEIVQAFDRASITALKTDDASALERRAFQTGGYAAFSARFVS